MKNAQEGYISHPCSWSPIDAIFIKFGTVIHLTYVMIYVNFSGYRLKGGHSAAVQIYLFLMT